MKFGKLSDITGVDFSLPQDPKGTKLVLGDLPKRTTAPKVYIGATGWGMKEWVGQWYPEKTPTKDYLKAYSKQFNTIELNTTHYRIPREDLIDRWYEETTDDFVFCPKIPQVISHSRQLGMDTERVRIFMREIKGLKEKLGCCFMQLPPYYQVDRLPVLAHFLGEWDAEIPLAVEVRHPSWFHSEANSEKLFHLLERFNISTVITDVAGRRDVLHNRLTTDTAMIRFVGNALDTTDYQRLDDWVLKLKDWFAQGLTRAYFFSHQPDNILSPDAAVYWVQQLQQHIPNVDVRGPKNLDRQMNLFG